MPATQDDVHTALRVLRAGCPGQHPEIGDDVVTLWTFTLHPFPGPVLDGAARAWVANQSRFPSLNEFMDAAQAEARRLATVEENTGVRGSTRCPECGGNGMVYVPVPACCPAHPASEAVRPCSRCNGRAYAKWRGGHDAPGHGCQECRDDRRGRRRTDP